MFKIFLSKIQCKSIINYGVKMSMSLKYIKIIHHNTKIPCGCNPCISSKIIGNKYDTKLCSIKKPK